MPHVSYRTCTVVVKAPGWLVICAAVIHIIHTRMRLLHSLHSFAVWHAAVVIVGAEHVDQLDRHTSLRVEVPVKTAGM
jgi:predicted proteasome-type protease